MLLKGFELEVSTRMRGFGKHRDVYFVDWMENYAETKRRALFIDGIYRCRAYLMQDENGVFYTSQSDLKVLDIKNLPPFERRNDGVLLLDLKFYESLRAECESSRAEWDPLRAEWDSLKAESKK